MLLPESAHTAPVSAKRAEKVASAWARSSQNHLGKPMKRTSRQVNTFTDDDGEEMFHIIHLDEGGFVVLPADDEIEPIIAFASEGALEANPENPLWTLISQDVPARIKATRSSAKRAMQAGPSQRQQRNKNKWQRFEDKTDLQNPDYADEPLIDMGTPSINDERVNPLVASRWNQDTVGYPRVLCYNYYTPKNYVSGCVATAMAQVIRYWQHPTTGIGVYSHDIVVDGVGQSANTRGGDGAGGAYNWSIMPLTPNGSTPEASRQMIGALLYDCGVTVEMSYSSSGSGASTYDTSIRLKDRFGYANSVYTQGTELTTGGLLNRIVNPNLDLGCPTILSIRNDKNQGHAIIADGYGYNSSTMYHHLNMGWGGSQDAWYNLPNVDEPNYGFSKVQAAVYNIFVSGTGEIISGRVLNHDGTPAQGINVTATSASGSWSDATNDKGIYAIKVPVPASRASYSVSCAGAGAPVSVQVGRSGFSSCGNVWGADLSLNTPNTPPSLKPIGNITIQAGKTITFTIDATDPDPAQTPEFSATGE